MEELNKLAKVLPRSNEGYQIGMDWRKGLAMPLCHTLSFVASVTRFGDLLDLGQLFKAFGYN